MKAGVAINPDTDINLLEKYIQEIDLVCVMGVFPGFSGQAFIEATYDRCKAVKELINKDAIFNCKILNVKEPTETKIDDEFAKNLGAKDLNNLKELITKQINDEFKNSLKIITKKKILEQIEKFKKR